ncbi:MAG: c-type cytochrome [Aromatoleum sp.]|nr:c-type cytochrome [Aromatoleum sp.]
MKRSTQTIFITLATLVAVASGAGYSPSAAAQPARVQQAGADDLRAVYANAAEVAEGKRVAETSCANCHGTNGISTTTEVPNLAGQRAAYLHFELRAYKSGSRGDTAMNAAINFLSDDALLKAAAYYASLDPAQPASAAIGAKASSASTDPVQAGKAMAAGCVACHGEGGVSKTPGTPSLVGLDPKYLVTAMKAYKGGQRKNDVMKSMLAKATDADLSNIALHYALQKPARAQTTVPGDQEAGKSASAVCAGCHGDQGVSGTPVTPSLAGQNAQYLAAALRAYKDGSRSDESMKAFAASLDDGAIKNLSAYYAAQQPQPPKVSKPVSIAEWAQKCDRCHGINGNSTDPRLPALAAQRADYLEKVLHAYRTGARKSPQMAAMSDVLTETDIMNLAAHYARQKARAVVYVTLPAK